MAESNAGGFVITSLPQILSMRKKLLRRVSRGGRRRLTKSGSYFESRSHSTSTS